MDPDEYPVFTALGKDTIVDDTRTWVDPKGYRLSGRIWNARAIDSKAMDKVLYAGIASGKAALATAKDLEQFLTPEASSSKTRYPTGRGSGNAAARRLARTETSHSFAVAQLKTDEASPFVDGSKWNLSGSHLKPDECNDNAQGHSPGMQPGEYQSGSFPRIPSHPHCLCYPTSVITQDADAVVAQLLLDLTPPMLPFEVLKTAEARFEAAVERAVREGKISEGTGKQHLRNAQTGKYDIEHIRKTTDFLNFRVDPQRALQHGIAVAEQEGAVTVVEAAELREAVYSDKEIEAVLKQLRAKAAALRAPAAPLQPVSVFEDLEAFRKKFKFAPYKRALVEDYNKWRAISTKEEGQALDAYKDGAYSAINRRLRKGVSTTTGNVEKIADIDSALAKARTSEPGIVMRGIRFRAGKPPDEWANAKIGDIVTDKGYMSTTTNIKTAEAFGAGGWGGEGAMMLEILVPADTPALSLIQRGGGTLKNEEELLLMRDLKFKVRSISKEPGRAWKAVFEVIP